MRWRAASALAMMVLAVVASDAWRPTRRLSDLRPELKLESIFPSAFGNWQIDDYMPVQLVSPDQAAVLNRIYSQTLSRTYVNPTGERIMLSIAYGGDQSDATRTHRPEVCYPAQGFEIVSSSYGVIVTGWGRFPVRRLVARQGNRNEPITYWMVVGDRVAVNSTQQKLAQLSYSTRGVVPDGMLVRVSSIGTDVVRAYAMQDAFIGALAARIPGGVRSNFFGVGVD